MIRFVNWPSISPKKQFNSTIKPPADSRVNLAPVRMGTLIAIFGLISASSFSATAAESMGIWDIECHSGFEARIIGIVGAEAVNCGILQRSVSGGDPTPHLECVRDALRTGASFRVAHATIGDHAWYCEAAGRTTDGVFYGAIADYAGSSDALRRAGKVETTASRCSRITLEPGSIGPGSFFSFHGCYGAAN